MNRRETPRAVWRKPATLALAAGSTAAAIAAGKCAWLAHSVAVGRIESLRLPWMATRLLERILGPWDALPRRLQDLLLPVDLSNGRLALEFAASAILVNVIMALAIALVVAAPVWLVGVRFARRRPGARGSAFAFHLGLAAVVAVQLAIEATKPAYELAIEHGLRHAQAVDASFALTAGMFVLVTGTLSLAFHRIWSPRSAGYFLSCAVAASALTLAAVLATSAEWRRPPAPVASAQGKHPNLVLISIDTLRADHLGCYGYARPTSPYLDALAAGGLRFSETIAPSSWTLPSHMTMWTALAPAAHKVITRERRLRSYVQTLAEVLRDAGYQTAAVVAGGYLRAEYGHIQGFESYDDETLHRSCGQESHRTCVTGPVLLAKALRRLARLEQRAADGRPFFLLVHLWDVHGSYVPPPPYAEMFGKSYHGHRPFSEVYEALYHGRRPSDAELEHLVALYDGEIRYTDDIVGDLLNDLSASGFLDRTVVAVTADHGEEFFEHGTWGHEHNLYRETVHVPLILRYPARLAAGTVIDEPLRLAELAPMLLSVLGVPAPASFGQAGGDSEPGWRNRTAMWTNVGTRLDPGISIFGDLKGRVSSLRSGRWKVIEQRDRSPSEPGVELYDLATDLHQHVDVHERHPELCGRLLAELDRWREHWSRSSAAAPYADTSERLRDLRALGYAQ